jgi:hypothetical protein
LLQTFATFSQAALTAFCYNGLGFALLANVGTAALRGASMGGNDPLEQMRARYEQLLAEVREVAARVRARLEELRRQFPDDESLTPQLLSPVADSPRDSVEECPQPQQPNTGPVARRSSSLRQRNPGGRRSPHAAAPTAKRP